ncbi:hypothetical protein [Streptomyces sp. NPDC005303]|uniref:hypothetical protein n=1 Tax=Streptomyces sp. NPDC005303 TaxID=3155713 RepID=UPI0033BB7CFD
MIVSSWLSATQEYDVMAALVKVQAASTSPVEVASVLRVADPAAARRERHRASSGITAE